MTRDEAIKYLIKPVSTSTVPSKEIEKQFEAYEMAIEALRQKPYVHAHWKDNYVFIKNDHTNIECSNCLCDIDVKSDDTEIYRYCPWCGAKMDEGVTSG